MSREKFQLIRALKEKRRRQVVESFWEYCKETSPIVKRTGRAIYRDDVEYLKNLAEDLQNLIENKLVLPNGKVAKGICISLPPRHAKSLTVKKLSQWILGVDKNIRLITASYSQDLMNQFSKEIKNTINEQESSEGIELKYGDIFPGLQVAKDSKSAKKWKLQGSSHDFTFATGSFRTGVTGLGADIMIIDDPIKNSEEALNEKVLEDKWSLFTDTFLSRLEGDGKLIIIQTRWSENDIIGKIIKSSTLSNIFKIVELKAVEEIENGELKFLNEDLFTREEYEIKKAEISELIFEANYNQRIIDLDTALYKKYRFYTEFPESDDYKTVAVLDPSADGEDYTVVLVGRYYKKIEKIFLTDIFYSNRNITEIEDNIVDFIAKNNPDEIVIESNSAFVILTNNIRKALIKKGCTTKINQFKQTKNKEARILTASNAVQETIYFMSNAESAHKEAFNHFKKFKANISANKHDDFEDAITLMWEKFIKSNDKNKATGYDKKFFI